MISISVAGFVRPLVAVSCASTVAFAGKSGTNFIYWCNGAVGTAFNYYIYDTSDELPASFAGMEAYNTLGEITFSSNFRPISVLGLNAGTTTYAGRTIAAGLFTWGGFEFIGGLECWDGGSAAPWSDPESSGACDDLRYRRRVNVRGALIDTGGTRIVPGGIVYEDVRVSAGDSTDYDEPPGGLDMSSIVAAVDVTGIPIGSTFF
jgi:hypothetical protein